MVSVSLIVPCFKRVTQTIRTIELLFASSGIRRMFDVEMIVADSTPGDELRLAINTSFGDCVQYTRPAKPGIAANKNQGARIAHHPILIFCDSDIEVEPETMMRTVASLEKNPNAAAVGGNVIWRGGAQDGVVDRPRPEDRLQTKETTVYCEALYSRFIAMFRDVFVAVGGYDETVFTMRGEGSDLSARLWRAGYPLTYDASIIVHHVYDAPDSAALRVPHPEWGIAHDMLLLAYKYGMLDRAYPNFVKTVAANFWQETAVIDAFRAADQPRYPFGFLEVFTDKKLCDRCIANAEVLLRPVRTSVFPA